MDRDWHGVFVLSKVAITKAPGCCCSMDGLEAHISRLLHLVKYMKRGGGGSRGFMRWNENGRQRDKDLGSFPFFCPGGKINEEKVTRKKSLRVAPGAKNWAGGSVFFKRFSNLRATRLMIVLNRFYRATSGWRKRRQKKRKWKKIKQNGMTHKDFFG